MIGNLKNHKWTREDDILALDAYFRCGKKSVADPIVARAQSAINPETKSFMLKLSQIRSLNLLESVGGLSGVPMQLREVWAEYCRDDSWMIWRLQQSPAPDFREACRDISRLQKDAADIFRVRESPLSVPRREARKAAMHILYAARAQDISAADSLLLMRKSASSAREKSALNDAMVQSIVAAADASGEEIEQHISDAAGRASEKISAVESAILRTAVAELLSHPRSGRAMIIDEAVQIAKQFGSEGGYKIVNGALDKIAAQLPQSDA